MKTTGCARLVILAVMDRGLRDGIAKSLHGSGIRVEILAAEHPLDLYRVALAYSTVEPPESILVVTDSPVVLGAEEARRSIGLVKLLQVHGCTVDEIVESIEAVSCKPKPAPCPVDAGLGWLQA